MALSGLGRVGLGRVGLGRGLEFGDDFDLDQGVLGEGGDGDGGAGRGWYAFGCEILGVDGVHGGEVAHVLEEDSGFDDVDEVHACLLEDGFEAFAGAGGLLGDAAGDHLAGDGIECDLAGGVEGVADADGLGVGADGGRGLAGDDGGFGGLAHGVIVYGADGFCNGGASRVRGCVAD